MKEKKVNERKRTSERGQSIILMAFAFVGFLIIIGLAIDLGLVYIERVRLGRAVDAAALGAVQELPNEEAAFRRALMFLSDNGYDCNTNAKIFRDGNTIPVGPPLCSDLPNAVATFGINTINYREGGEENTAMRIEVEGQRRVPLNFMKFAGPEFNEVPVPGRAVAENVQNLDVAIVFDRSGSMEFDTICYGCWEVDEGDGYDYAAWPSGEEYSMGDGERGGVAHPLSYPHDLCSGSPYWDTYSSQTYIVIEAEHYTYNWPTFDPAYRLSNSTYWGLQRNGRGTTTVGGCSGEDGEVAGCGGYMQHNPFAYVTEDQVYTADPDDDYGYYTKAPQLIYDFRVPGPGRYYVWLRAQGGYNGGTWSPYPNYVRYVHWGVDGDWKGNPGDFEYGGDYRGARNNEWRWREVGYFDLDSNWNDPITHTLNIWAGGTGFRLDKIVITSASNGQSVLCNGCWDNCSNCYSDKGPPATSGGRDGYACWLCNPLYGRPLEGSYCEGIWQDNPQWGAMYVAMFDDQQPVRASKEAVKLFVEPPEEMENRLEPRFDQIGFVSYSSSSSIDSELECIIKRPGDCTDFHDVLAAVELPDADGTTNTGSGLWDGILVLYNGLEGTSAENPLFRVLDRLHYGRPGTSRFIILLTDGVPTANPGYCPDLWPDGGRDYDCAVYYAEKAREQGIILYTIGLGQAVDEPLLIHMADVANGAYFPAKNKEALDGIFLEILSRIYIRLVE